jgi:RIO kinase 1
MELFTTEDGGVAPPLITTHLSPEVASALFAALCADVERMLWLDVLHGDLSPYNVLWNGAGYRVIDFPQAVDPRFNGNALRLLQRDLDNVARFCARFGEVPDPATVAVEMWQRFQHGEPP